MDPKQFRVTIHMAASADGFIARRNGAVDWLETSDIFPEGLKMDAGEVDAFLRSIDCYVMGSHTYETAVAFENKGFGWAYGEKPVYVLTTRNLTATRSSINFKAGNLADVVEKIGEQFRNIWFVGGGMLCGECLRLRLADEIRYSILPVLIGDGISFFDKLDGDVPLHLRDVKAFNNGMVSLHYDVRRKSDQTAEKYNAANA